MWKDIMTRKRKPAINSMNDFKDIRWVECYVDTAVNPVTRNQVTLTPPVRIGCFEDFARFYDQFEEFCVNDLKGLDPDEVCFTLELTCPQADPFGVVGERVLDSGYAGKSSPEESCIAW